MMQMQSWGFYHKLRQLPHLFCSQTCLWEQLTLYPAQCYNYIGGYLYYDGESKNDKFDDYGVLYHYGTNTPSYEGEFKNDMRHGSGTSYSETGEVIYQGNWKNNDYAYKSEPKHPACLSANCKLDPAPCPHR